MARTNSETLLALGKGFCVGTLFVLFWGWPAVLFPFLYDRTAVVVWLIWCILILFMILFLAVKHWDDLR